MKHKQVSGSILGTSSSEEKPEISERELNKGQEILKRCGRKKRNQGIAINEEDTTWHTVAINTLRADCVKDLNTVESHRVSIPSATTVPLSTAVPHEKPNPVMARGSLRPG